MNQRGQFLKNETRRYAVFGVLFGLLFPIGATFISIAGAGLPFGASSIAVVQSTDPLLWIIDTAPIFLGFFASLAGRRQDNLQKINSELLVKENELRYIQATLEQSVELRTQELSIANQGAEKRVRQLQIIAEIARAIISVRKIDTLMPLLTQSIGDRFGFYHVGVFLLDESKQYAILRSANSAGGLMMLQRGHRLRIGEQTVIGFVAQSARALIDNVEGQGFSFQHDAELPMTKSQIALPLKSENQIMGVLDIQSSEAQAFTEDDIPTLSILADQVAIAIQNALLDEQLHRSLRETESTSRQASSQAWKGYAETIQTRGYRYDGIRPEPLKQIQKSDAGEHALSIPVQLRGQTIGRLKLRASEASRVWTDDELAVIEATAERVALALEGARLLEDAQKRAARETFLSDVAAKLGTSFQLDSILRDTVEELGKTFKNSTISFQLVNPSAPKAEPQKSNGASAGSENLEQP